MNGQSSLPPVWTWYFSLSYGEGFVYNEKHCTATGFCSAHTVAGEKFFIAPWTLVCYSLDVPIEYPIWETQGGTTPEQNDAHFDREKSFPGAAK